MAVFDGIRTGLLPPLDPGQSASFKTVLRSPSHAGTYVLHLTLVQEQNFSFEQVTEPFGREITVVVI
jgi:hypothetical protein